MSHHRSLAGETPPATLSRAVPKPERVPDLETRRTSQRHLLQERVSGAIVAAAAELLANKAAAASMADVAAAAGMARATVYRYFPTREALLDRVAEVAITDAGARLEEARLDAVSPEEAVARAVRAFFDVGDYFIVLARERVRVDSERRKRLIEEPLRQLFGRGQRKRVFRGDLPPELLASALLSMVEAVSSQAPALGRDDTVDRVAGLFLDGIRARTRR